MVHMNPTTSTERIALTAARARELLGISYEHLSAKTGIPVATLHRSLNAGRPMNTAELERLAPALGFADMRALLDEAAA